MPDSSANQKAYPQSKAQGIGLGFPLVRMVALISLTTGVVRDLALGPYQGKETGETALFRTLWEESRSRRDRASWPVSPEPSVTPNSLSC